jgi:hypothetical protein
MMDAERSDSFQVFSVIQTLKELVDQVPELTRAGVEFVVIDGGDGHFGAGEVEKLPAELKKLKVPPDVRMDKVELTALFPHMEVAVRNLRGYTDSEIDDLVSVKGRVIEISGPEAKVKAIYSEPGRLGDEMLGGLFSTPPGEIQNTEGDEYTLKYCPHCDKPYFILLKVEGKGVCPHCCKEVLP